MRKAGCEALPKKLNLTNEQLEELRHLKCDCGFTITEMVGKVPYSKTFITNTLIKHGWYTVGKPYVSIDQIIGIKQTKSNTTKREYSIAGMGAKSKTECKTRRCLHCRRNYKPYNKYNYVCSDCKNDENSSFRYMAYV